MPEPAPKPRRKKKRRPGRVLRNWLVERLGHWLIRAWIGSIRYRVHTPVNVHPFHDEPTRHVYAFWHQRLLAFAYTHRGSGVRILISSHGDGEMIASTVKRLGLEPVRGSSTRGGVRALRELLEDLGSGKDYAFTPDGPRGPRHEFQLGAVYFASRSGLPLITASVSYRRSWSLPTWDGFILPAPFTRGVIHVNPPVTVPPDLSDEELESHRRRFEEDLRRATREADENFEDYYRRGQSFREMDPSRGPFRPTRTLEPETTPEPGGRHESS